MLPLKIINSIGLYLFILSYVCKELLSLDQWALASSILAIAITALAFGIKGSREIFLRQGKIFTFGQTLIVAVFLYLRFF